MGEVRTRDSYETTSPACISRAVNTQRYVRSQNQTSVSGIDLQSFPISVLSKVLLQPSWLLMPFAVIKKEQISV